MTRRPRAHHATDRPAAAVPAQRPRRSGPQHLSTAGAVLFASCLWTCACSGALTDGPAGPSQSSSDGVRPPTPEEVQAGFQCDPNAPLDPGPAPLLRLTPGQYRATARQLFGDDLRLDDVLPRDATDGHIGLAQADPSRVEVESYAAAAERVADHVGARLSRFAPCDQPDDANAARTCVRQFLATMGQRIYRAPLGDNDVDALLQVFQVGFEDAGYQGGVKLTLQAMLESPRFLYRPELGDRARAQGGAVPLTDYELASRLSFAFWNQGPDDALLEAAAAGALSTPEGLRAQARRLMEDPRAAASFHDFMRVWFGLNDLDTVEKDPGLFPEWGDQTRAALKEQRDAFFEQVLFGQDGSLEALFSLDPRDFAPEALADWQQGMPGQGAGVLSLPAVLSAHSKPTESFPIYRGLMVREQLLCQPLPAPPANVPEPPEPEAGVSTRERFEQHSSEPACRGCHRLIDDLGFAFEHFDAVGHYRAKEGEHQVDASGELTGTDVDGPFRDLPELADRLAESETVRQCVARQWFRFVTQRFERPADGCSMQSLSDAFKASGYRFEALRSAIVETPAFRMRRPFDPEEAAP